MGQFHRKRNKTRRLAYIVGSLSNLKSITISHGCIKAGLAAHLGEEFCFAILICVFKPSELVIAGNMVSRDPYPHLIDKIHFFLILIPMAQIILIEALQTSLAQIGAVRQ